MKLFKLGLLAMVIVAFGSINGVKADIINPFNTWYEFSFTGTVPFANGCSPADPGGLDCVPSSGGNTEFAPAPAWEFSSLNDFYLIVTDAFEAGDAFNIYNYGSLIGWTNSVSYALTYIDDPDIALLDTRFSQGYFPLLAGPYSITIKPYQTLIGELAILRLPFQNPRPCPYWALAFYHLLD